MYKQFVIYQLLLLFTLSVFSQSLVTTEPSLKTVVLENYTGVQCGNCPSGHTIAENIRAANPDRVIIISIHVGSYAVPPSGQPDFRTSFGTSLANQSKLTGYPAGSINRHIFSSYAMNNGTAMQRSYWASAANQILPQTSPVNVGVKSVFDPTTRLLTVDVEAYYTSTPGATTNYLNVALLESNVVAYQSGGSSNYNHKNILRHLLTGQWGDTLKNLSANSFRSKTYTYTVPSTYNINNCDVAVFVSQNKEEIYSGKKVAANGGTTEQIASFGPTDYIETANPSVATDITIPITSNMSGSENFNFSLTNDAPGDWAASFTINGSTYTNSGNANLTHSTPTNIEFSVIPGNTSAIATYTLTVSSVSQPTLPAIIKKIIIISNVSDLVVNNDAEWGDGGTTTASGFQTNFLDGLQHAGETKYTSTPLNTFLRLGNADKLDNIIAVYYNVGWSFPSLTTESVAVFKQYLDNGGNLLISGQDIGWDNFDVANGGHGNTTTQNFYKNYLKATFVSDGSPSNAQLTIEPNEAIFGSVSNSSIVNAYGSSGGNPLMYPDEINPTTSGIKIFYYNNDPTKIGGVRSLSGNYKTVNMGLSLEMIGDASIRKEFMKKAYQWFHGLISGNEFDKEIAEVFNNCYPNPAIDYTYIPVNNSIEKCELYDFSGKLIKSIAVAPNTNLLKVDLSELQQGHYFYTLSSKDAISVSKKLQILR